jgi:uncharacterized membrane protein YkvA (DUF1232 family)
MDGVGPSDLNDPPSLDYERLHDAVHRLAALIGGDRLGRAFASVALAGPDLVVFAGRALRDERIPRKLRGEIIASAIFIASPFELVPVTLFGPAGLVDDALVAARLFDVLLNRIEPAIVRELWPGERAVLERLQSIAAEGRKVFGAGLRQGVRLLARRGARQVARLVRDVGGATLRLGLAPAPDR